MKTVVIALGGNALEDGKNSTAENQLKIIKQAVVNIADLIESGYQVVVTHGNGPQIGRIIIQNELSNKVTPAMPFDVCGAMSQGMIGYHLQQALQIELQKRNINKPVATLITQVIVDDKDPAFNNPTKPIGPFYSKEEKDQVEKERGYILKEDSNRGYRRVIASPKPQRIVELESIKNLIKANSVVITCGGGGVPVIEKDNQLQGIAAVIDKDWASAKLANDLGADYLIILTAVPQVYINYSKPNQEAISSMNIAKAQQYIEEKQFAPGSMLPKVEATIAFVQNNSSREAIITSLEKAKEAITKGTTGTKVVAH